MCDNARSYFAYCRILSWGMFAAGDGGVRDLFIALRDERRAQAEMLYDSDGSGNLVVTYRGRIYDFCDFLSLFQAMLFDRYGMLLGGLVSAGNPAVRGILAEGRILDLVKDANAGLPAYPRLVVDPVLNADLPPLWRSSGRGPAGASQLVAIDADGVSYVNYILRLRDTIGAGGSANAQITDSVLARLGIDVAPSPVLAAGLNWMRTKFREMPEYLDATLRSYDDDPSDIDG